MKTQISERTFVLVLPEAEKRTRWVMRQLKDKKDGIGAEIILTRMITMNEDAIRRVGHDLTGPLKDAAHRHLAGEQALFIMVEGDDIVRRVRDLVGTHPNPRECIESSMRFKLSSDFDLRIERFENGTKYFRNYVLCPMTVPDANESIKFFTGSSVVSHPYSQSVAQ